MHCLIFQQCETLCFNTVLKQCSEKKHLVFLRVISTCFHNKWCAAVSQNKSVQHYHCSPLNMGRYGHRLIKLWEQSDYTTEPLKVYRTGGRFPTKQHMSSKSNHL